jgi:hypothetical protein
MLEDGAEERKEMLRKLNTLEKEVTILKVQTERGARMWGFIAGSIPVVLAIALKALGLW